MAEEKSIMSKASGPARRRPAWVRPAAFLGVIITGAAVAIVVLNTPAPKALEIDVACQAFQSPGEIVFPISAERLRRVHLRGCDGRLERAARLDVDGVSEGGVYESTNPPTLTFRADPDLPVSSLPSLSLQVEGNPGPMTLRIGPGVLVRGSRPTKESLSLDFQSKRAGDLGIELEMDAVKVEANRFAISELRKVAAFAEEDSFNIDASGGTGMVRCRFQSLKPPPGSKSAATLDFSGGAAGISLIQPDEGEPGLTVNEKTILLSGKIDGEIRLENEAPREVKGADTDLRIAARQFDIRSITVEAPEEPRQPATLRVRGRGQATSVKRSNQEFVPTMLEEILNKPPAQKGLFGLLAGFCALAATVFANRALALLANLLLPDPKPDQGDQA
jgi:hypothetical protein